MNDNDFKVGDIFRWHWNTKTLKELEYKNNSGTLYWCCSNICVFNEDHKLWDTYWGGRSWESKRFSISEANEKLSLQYVDNFSNLVKANKADRAYYADKECVDLSHANRSTGEFYLRKGAKKSIAKMRRIIERNIRKRQDDVAYAKEKADLLEIELATLDINSYVETLEGVSLYDDVQTLPNW